MIRSTILSLTLLLVLSQCAGADEPKAPIGEKPTEQLVAQGEAKPANPQPQLISNAFGGGKSAAEWYIERTDSVVKLSDEQKKKINELFAAREKAMREFQAGLEAKAKDASAALAEAMKSKDQQRIAREQKAYQEMFAPMQEMMKKSEAALQNVLTKEQRDKLNDSQVTTLVKALTPGVELSDEQLKQIKEKVGTVTGWGEIGGRKAPEVLEQILTHMQISTIIRQRTKTYITAMFGSARLTPEQLTKIDAKIGELTRSQKKLTQFDVNIYNSLQEFVTNLLTAEQKEAQQKRGFSIVNAPGQKQAGGLALGTRLNPQPAGGATTDKPTERKSAEAGAPNVKVTQLPGGGVQVTIHEGVGEERSGNAGQEELDKARQRLNELQKQAESAGKNSMRERVKRQHELAKQAMKLIKKMDALEADKKKHHYELWEELERVEGQLRQTFGVNPYAPALGQAFGAWQQLPQQPGQAGLQMPGAPLTRTNSTATGPVFTLQPGASAPNPRPGAGSDLAQEVQSLRCQLEELREQVQKLSERGSKPLLP